MAPAMTVNRRIARALRAVCDTYIERLVAAWDGWRRGAPLTAEQRAARMAEAWSLPAAYQVTQPGDRRRSCRTWVRAQRVYLQRRHEKATS